MNPPTDVITFPTVSLNAFHTLMTALRNPSLVFHNVTIVAMSPASNVATSIIGLAFMTPFNNACATDAPSLAT